MPICPQCNSEFPLGRKGKIYCSRNCKQHASCRRNKRDSNRVFTPERKARNRINNAVTRGELPHISELRCQVCGTQAEHYHHPDYRYTLLVVPLCEPCHHAEHDKGEGWGLAKTKIAL